MLVAGELWVPGAKKIFIPDISVTRFYHNFQVNDWINVYKNGKFYAQTIITNPGMVLSLEHKRSDNIRLYLNSMDNPRGYYNTEILST